MFQVDVRSMSSGVVGLIIDRAQRKQVFDNAVMYIEQNKIPHVIIIIPLNWQFSMESLPTSDASHPCSPLKKTTMGT